MIDATTHKKILESIDRKIIKQSKIKNILITGCGGFIGIYLVSALLSNKFNAFFRIYGYTELFSTICFICHDGFFVFILCIRKKQ